MSRRSGFTLFQLLLLIALFAIGFAMMLPALAAARMEAVKMASANNLKQIGLGVHSYHDVNNLMPAGVDAKGFSAAAYILPYLEQGNLFQRIDFKQAPTDRANAPARATAVKTFLAPLDRAEFVTKDSAPTNYLFCAGTKPDLQKNDGCFFVGSKIQLQAIPDGTSNTIMAGETLRGDGGVRAMNVARQHVELKADALKGLKPEAGVEDWKGDKNIAANRGAAWMDGRFLQGTFTATRMVNDDKPDVDCSGAGGLSALRGGKDGVWVLLGDGSVRRLSAKVPLNVVQILAGRDDGMVTPDF